MRFSWGGYDQQVYPRVCGGTPVVFFAHHKPLGLSPRVRGNLNETPRQPCRGGSIPACAGEPLTSAWEPGIF